MLLRVQQAGFNLISGATFKGAAIIAPRHLNRQRCTHALIQHRDHQVAARCLDDLALKPGARAIAFFFPANHLKMHHTQIIAIDARYHPLHSLAFGN